MQEETKDTDRMAPIKDDNEVLQKSDLKDCQIFIID